MIRKPHLYNTTGESHQAVIFPSNFGMDQSENPVHTLWSFFFSTSVDVVLVLHRQRPLPLQQEWKEYIRWVLCSLMGYVLVLTCAMGQIQVNVELSQPRDPAEPRAPVEALPQTPRPFVTPPPCYCLHRSSERSALPFIVTMFPFVFGYYFLPFRYVTPCLCSYYS